MTVELRQTVETPAVPPSPTAEVVALPPATGTHTPLRVPARTAATRLPELAPGVELLGPYEGSGFREPRYLARRGDGQMIQLPRLLYLVAEEANGERTSAEIARSVGQAISRRIAPDDIDFLLDERLRPLGLIRFEDDVEVEPAPRADPMLALRVKTALVPPAVTRILGAMFSPLFFPPVIIAVLSAAAGLDYWLFSKHGIAQSVRAAFYDPGTLLLILALVALSAAFHECGHAAAARYGGANPGAMGAGLYLVWPAFYTDLTDAYTLGRRGRLRADLGGVYFNTIFMLLTGGAYFITGFEPLLVLIPLQQLEIVHQLLPLLRLDGYYIVSDLTGVPDILARIKPTLKSLVPGIEPDQRVRELRPWVRAVVTAYVLVLVPILLFMFAMIAIAAPRVLATAWHASFVTWRHLQLAVDRRQELMSLASIIQLVVLVLSPLGLILMLARASRRVAGGVWRGTETRPRARALLVAATSATITALFVNWWVAGAYRPIGPTERGVLSQASLHIGRVGLIQRQPPAQSPVAANDSRKGTLRTTRPVKRSANAQTSTSVETRSPANPTRANGFQSLGSAFPT